MSEYLNERIYFPDGMAADDYDARHFAVHVQWRGKGEWAVTKGLGYPAHSFLSRTGKWLFLPQPMHRRYCRFDFETACEMAEKYVDSVEVNGGTWAQWQARRTPDA